MDPCNLFGYERLGFDASVPFGELSCADGGVDASATGKAWGTSTMGPQPQAKAPGGKNVTKVPSSVTSALLEAATSTSFAKESTATTPGGYSCISADNDFDDCKCPGEGTQHIELS